MRSVSGTRRFDIDIVATSGLQLDCGSVYYLDIVATNCAGLSRMASSSAKLCCTPPSVGTLQLADYYGREVDVLQNGTEATISWSGFADACSGVREYSLQILEGTTVHWSVTVGSTVQAYTMPLEALDPLASDMRYFVAVTATNNALLSSVMTTPFVVDRTPPAVTAPQVRWRRHSETQQSGLVEHCIPSDAEMLEVRWNATDPGSGIRSYSVAFGHSPAPAEGDLVWKDMGMVTILLIQVATHGCFAALLAALLGDLLDGLIDGVLAALLADLLAVLLAG